jgi:hypothetical protein
MTLSKRVWLSGSAIKRTLLFAALMVCGISSPVMGQEIVKGSFTLSEGARFGTTLLPPGNYTVSIEPVTAVKASGSLVSVFVRAENKINPVASVLAMASQQNCESTPSGLTLLSDGVRLVARSLCLDKQGLMVDFDLWRSRETSKAALPAAPALAQR